ncbi:hypothetical protein HFO84_00020 [Rhizobium leguminosarum]|uniref:hypothetical protein n=1 Tax=Rhizobium leguminosarum TaxID=384 RepID=UPI001C988B28|nr:hypothetical protein [Rhizobium leguminosarum]MBY5475716.1 hypothetical protein [Rhizobium leguminosarum]
MELYTQAFVIKVGYALLTSICPAGVAPGSGECMVATDWIDDPALSEEGLATCTRIGESRYRFANKGTVYTYECNPYAGGSRYGEPSKVEKRVGDVDIAEVGAPTDMPELGFLGPVTQ